MINSPVSKEDLGPVVKTLQVRIPVEAAFRLLTEGFGRWWPLDSHSVSLEEAAACTLEAEAGGRIYEVHQDGRQFEWGRVLAWEPPHRLVFTWHPGRDAESGQEVEVTFQSEPGGTRVVLEHRGWEHLGERAAAVRQNYVSGWDIVLGKYQALGHP